MSYVLLRGLELLRSLVWSAWVAMASRVGAVSTHS
jgi:hypothetical protein